MNWRYLALLGTTIGVVVIVGLASDTAAARKYTLIADADTTVTARQPQTNFGREPYLFLESDASPRDYHVASILLHFDLSSVQVNPGDRVSSAQLRLTQVGRRGWGSMQISARRLGDPFVETQTVWDHPTRFYDAESYDLLRDFSQIISVPAPLFFRDTRTLTFDVKDIVEPWLEAGERNDGLMIAWATEDLCRCRAGLVFFSRESRDDSNPALQDFTPRALGKQPVLTIGVEPAQAKR